MSLGSLASSNVFKPGDGDNNTDIGNDKSDDMEKNNSRTNKEKTKPSYAGKARNDMILSVDFEIKSGGRNISYPSTVGKILTEMLSVKQDEIEGVYRSNIFGGKGYMKIKIKERIDVKRGLGIWEM